MNHRLLFTLSGLMLVSLVASCGGQTQSSGQDNTSKAEGTTSVASSDNTSVATSEAASEEKIVLNDNRKELYSIVSATINSGGEVEEIETIDGYKSMYEAIHHVLDEEDPGSFVYLTSDEARTPLFKKFKNSFDTWHYYKDGNVLDGFYTYVPGDTEFFKGENYTRVLASAGYPSPTYQPYMLLGHESKTTQAWNRLPLLDASLRYNPHSFTGIQDTTYTVELSKAKFRPSYSLEQKVVPEISVSTTDSYNWSNQGILMDEETGNWYYFYGENQSQFKSFDTENEVIMKSVWDESTQEWTPEYDIRISLSQVYDEENEAVSNDMKLELMQGGSVVKTIEKNYEYSQMTMCGTHRFSLSLDLEPRSDDYEEEAMTPDFQCGAYAKNFIVSEGKGSVREGLTDDIYKGDSPMCCEAGQTYDLLHVKGGYENASDTEVILDNVNCVKYDETVTDKDVWCISYEQVEPKVVRTEEVEEVEDLIRMIPEDATTANDEFRTAYGAYSALHEVQQQLICQIDELRTIEDIIGE